jgi:hypothetical protein
LNQRRLKKAAETRRGPLCGAAKVGEMRPVQDRTSQRDHQ